MDKQVLTLMGMVMIRFLSSLIEFFAALLMIRLGSIKAALRINAALGIAGQVILISATLVGLIGMSGQVSPSKLLLVALGTGLVLIGTR